jgi:hypothetical protein
MKATQENNSEIISFFKERLRSWVEPNRKGVPKGEPYGMSYVKALSALLFLTNFKPKDVADTVEASHGVVRVWRTERYFQDTIKRHRRIFAEKIIDYLKPQGGRFINANRPDFSRLNDISLYSQELMQDIYDLAKRYATTIGSEEEFDEFIANIVHMFAIRKNHPLPLDYSNRTAIFDLAEILAQPWEADKSTIQEAKERFIGQIKELL